MNNLAFDPLLPPALFALLAVAAIAALVAYGLRKPAGQSGRRWALILGLMSLGALMVLVVLLNPTWLEPSTPPGGRPLLTILVDESASMATPDAPRGQTRFQAATAFLEQNLSGWRDQFEVRLLTFAGSATAAEVQDVGKLVPEGGSSDLAAGLATALEEDRPQGQAILLLSDGIHNAGGGSNRVLDVVRLAKAKACPIYVRTLGGEVAVNDVAVDFRTPQELAFMGQKVPGNVILRHRGFPGSTVKLLLKKDGKELERKEVRLEARYVQEVRFEVGDDKPGLHRYEVFAESLPGEATRINNASTMLLRVVDKPVRLLLLEGKPYWDGKFLTRTLFLDPSMALTSLVRVTDNRYLRRTLARDDKEPAAAKEEWRIHNDFADFLQNVESLRSYQIVLLGRNADVFLTDSVVAQLRTWVLRDGGSLICFRGQPTSQLTQRLSQMLPLRWSPGREARFQVGLTERGRDLRWFPIVGSGAASDVFADMPTLVSTARPEQPKPLSVVLATSQGSKPDEETPVLTYQPYGSGRVVVIEGAGMWRWAFLPPDQQDKEEVYRSLWHGLLRWLFSSIDLLPGQKLALRSDKVTFGTNEQATGTLLLREEGLQGPVPRVELRSEALPMGQQFTPTAMGDDPGTFRIAFGKLPEGRYEAKVVGAGDDPAATAVFDVRSHFEEQLDLKARPDLMARIAQDSGGKVLATEQGREIGVSFQEHQVQKQAKQRPAPVGVGPVVGANGHF